MRTLQTKMKLADSACFLTHLFLIIMFSLSCCIIHHEQGKVYTNNYYLKCFTEILFCLNFMCTCRIDFTSCKHPCCIPLVIDVTFSIKFHSTGISLMWLETTWRRFWSVMFSAVTPLPRTSPPVYTKCVQRSATHHIFVSLLFQDILKIFGS